ncbi:MAG: type II toxin-antitoxin system VapC family toxin [Candidatus Contendobacter sp.]|nr:MAG: type II toxin-antitoxin system VapC family toxin [Candidatus Contendobacter sp.]
MIMEKVLLDTNLLLVATIQPDALPNDIQQQLTDPTCTVFFSTASIWEIAIKRSLGRESFDFEPEDIYRLALETGFTELPVMSRHCFALTRMAWHHRDPFDRLLVVQAQSIPAYLFTTDGVLEKYSELVRKIDLS